MVSSFRHTPDTAFLDVTTMRTLAFLRFGVRSMISTRFPRHKLADDGAKLPPGQPIVTPSVIKAAILELFGQWELAGLVEDPAQFADELVVIRSSSDPNRVEAQLGPNLMNQFRGLSAQIQFLL